MARFTCDFISYTLLRAVDITVIIPSPTIPEALTLQMQEDNDHKNGKGKTTLDDPEHLCGKGQRLPDFPSHKNDNKYPVLYLLHGMGNNHATWIEYTNIEVFAEEQNIAVVMLSAENKSYINHEGGDRYFDFIEEELPEFVKGMFPISARKEDTYIAGLSMGGYGALIHGLSHPEKYQAVGAFSAAAPFNPYKLIGEERDMPKEYTPEYLIQSLKAEQFPSMFMSCGDEDPNCTGDYSLAMLMKKQGAEVTWISEPGYRHEWRFWNKTVEEFLDFLPRTDFYVGLGKRKI